MTKLKESPSQTAGPYVHIGCVPQTAGLEQREMGQQLGAKMNHGAQFFQLGQAGNRSHNRKSSVRDLKARIRSGSGTAYSCLDCRAGDQYRSHDAHLL